MPRFEPSIVEAAKTFPTTIVHAAIGQYSIREKDLSSRSRALLGMIQLLIKSGTNPAELIRELEVAPEFSDKKSEDILRAFFNSEFIDTARVVCVSTRFNNDALWAMYADKFKGCVIGFRHIPELSTPFLAAKKVSYSKHQPVAGSGIDFLLYGDTDQLRRSIIDSVCFTKRHHWADQQEWRVVTWRDEESETRFTDYRFYPQEVESVTLGMSATGDTELHVARLIEAFYPDCQLYRLVKENGSKNRVRVNLRGT
ncbi:hypothetical protein QUA52_30360 [Microcoleus sp. N9_A3]|uniref:hypothetical protein n=1 Tax=Microcoleus sp. N9_A3 TaxID=3055382 RepID=UPI002FD0A09F